jgi:ABC-type nitrate/sulfonate/bicarbonate transport system permease component
MDRAGAQARIIQLAIFALAAGGWYFITAAGGVNRLLLPSPGEVGTTLVRLVQTKSFWNSVGVTFSSILQAYVIAVVAGVVAGYLVTRSKMLMAVLEPIFSGLFTIPLTLLLPLFILFFGIGPASKIAYGATYAFFPVALNTIAAFGHFEERWLRAAQSMGASRWQTFRYILLPGAFPVLVTGLRIGFVICFASVLGGETIASAVGIGHNIALSAEQMEPGRLYAWIAFVTLTAITLNLLITSIENSIVKRERR